MTTATHLRSFLLWTVFLIGFSENFAPGQVYQPLYSFEAADFPRSSLVAASDGKFYGVTLFGGISNAGSIFQMNTNGEVTTLASFDRTGQTYEPHYMIQGHDGYFYGTTRFVPGSAPYGSLFRADTEGNLTNIVVFPYTNAGPELLVQGSDGYLYGTSHGYDWGRIFRASTNGMLSVLVVFNRTNGELPNSLIWSSMDDHLYGTTVFGGAYGRGTAFRLSTNGVLTTIYSFTNGSSAYPWGLIEGRDGNFYGTTGGITNSTIFKLSRDGTMTTLFTSRGSLGGDNPSGYLVEASDGRFYGTTWKGGRYNGGTMFSFQTNGMFRTLHSFPKGDTNAVRLVEGDDGALYGVDPDGGTNLFGGIFRLSLATPSLSFSRVNDQVHVHWPTWATGYRLEQSTTLTNWTAFNVVPNSNGTTFSVELPKRTNDFYRLSLPLWW